MAACERVHSDGKHWEFDELRFTDASGDVDARIPHARRLELQKLLEATLPWMGRLKSAPRIVIETRSTLDFRDFEKAPASAEYLLRLDALSRPECASAMVFASAESPPRAVSIQATPPHSCPPPQY